MTAIKLEREQTKRLTLKVLFIGDGSPTKNVRRIWLAFPLYPCSHFVHPFANEVIKSGSVSLSTLQDPSSARN
jgi:hypothetical protein